MVGDDDSALAGGSRIRYRCEATGYPRSDVHMPIADVHGTDLREPT